MSASALWLVLSAFAAKGTSAPLCPGLSGGLLDRTGDPATVVVVVARCGVAPVAAPEGMIIQEELSILAGLACATGETGRVMQGALPGVALCGVAALPGVVYVREPLIGSAK